MTEDQLDAYRSGYGESRGVILHRLRQILARASDCGDDLDALIEGADVGGAVEALIEILAADEEREHSELIQRE